MNKPLGADHHVSATAVPTTNQKLLAWVDEVAELTQPDQVVWCDGSAEEYDRLCHELVPCVVGPQRRGARRGPHVHLLRARGGRRADEQLARSGRDAQDDGRAV